MSVGAGFNPPETPADAVRCRGDSRIARQFPVKFLMGGEWRMGQDPSLQTLVCIVL